MAPITKKKTTTLEPLPTIFYFDFDGTSVTVNIREVPESAKHGLMFGYLFMRIKEKTRRYMKQMLVDSD